MRPMKSCRQMSLVANPTQRWFTNLRPPPKHGVSQKIQKLTSARSQEEDCIFRVQSTWLGYIGSLSDAGRWRCEAQATARGAGLGFGTSATVKGNQADHSFVRCSRFEGFLIFRHRVAHQTSCGNRSEEICSKEALSLAEEAHDLSRCRMDQAQRRDPCMGVGTYGEEFSWGD